MKKLYKISWIITLLLLTVSVKAQVLVSVGEGGITEPHPSTAFQAESKDGNLGMLIPQVSLVTLTNGTTPVASPKIGLMVYNLTDNADINLIPGYYYWRNNQWNPIGRVTETTTIIQDPIDPDHLGYVTTGTGATTLAAHPVGTTQNVAGVPLTALGCKKWTEGNGHSYCVYQGTAGQTWLKAFEIGKAKSGYLVTLTSDREWDWVKTNLINPGTGYNLTHHIWIGFNKVKNETNSVNRFTWITGERSNIIWNASPPRVEGNWGGGEPNNYDGVEGCGHVIPTIGNAERRWNDLPCTNTFSYHGNEPTGKANQFIIEFTK